MASQTGKQINKPITAAQIKRVHTLVHTLRIDDNTYRAALNERFSVTTCKDLNLNQAQEFIKDLEVVAIKHQHSKDAPPYQSEKQTKRFNDLENRPGMATPPQLRKIEAMWQNISIIPDQDARNRALRRFVHRIAAVADVRFLDREGASKVINALNAMERRNDKKPEKDKTRKNSRKSD